MKPVFVVGGLYSRANGVAWIMRDLAAAMGRAGSPVDVFGADCYGRGAASIGEIFKPPTRYLTRKGLWLGGLSASPALKIFMRREIQKADVIHNHSVWMLPNSYSSRIGLKQDKPVVITAHGALEPWALQNSDWKKKLVGRWFQFKDLQTASCIHVNSKSELGGIRQMGLDQTAAIIPNGVNLFEFENLPPADQFAKEFSLPKDKRYILFMGRLHKKKGLDLLVQAWAKLASRFADWHLVVAGPDDGLLPECKDIVAAAGSHSHVTFTGNLQGVQKQQALSACSMFVLPSHSEGFSMAVIEAMACRLPVLLTPGCNFPEAAQHGAAVQVEASITGTIDGLEELLTKSPAELQDMGNRGRDLVESGYTWDIVARKTLDLYEWLDSGNGQPEFVVD